MTFLNPAILWALAAVSIPVIIHLFNLRKSKKIEFSTLMFLKEIQETRQKKIKLIQLLILISRILMIIFLVIAFADPVFKSSTATERVSRTILIVIDNSFSMSGKNVKGTTFLDNAKAAASDILRNMQSGDEVKIITTSDIKNYNISGTEKSDTTAIHEIDISDRITSFDEILFYTGNFMANSLYNFKELYLITDMQKTGIKEFVPSAYGIENVNINIVKVSDREPSNITIDTINITTRIFEINKPVYLKTKITNHSTQDISGLGLNLIVNKGDFRSEKVIDITAGSTVEIDFTVEKNIYNYNNGHIEITQNERSDDEIINDNKRYFVYFVPQNINVLIVSGNSRSSAYLKAALGSASAITGTLFRFNETSNLNEYENINNNYDCIILNEIQNLNMQQTESLKSFSENNGIILIPPINGDLNLLNRFVNQLTGFDIFIQRFEDKSGHTRFNDIDVKDPIIEGIFREPDTDKLRYRLKEDAAVVYNGYFLQQVHNSRAIINLTNQANYLIKTPPNFIFFGSSLDESVSDLYVKNIFPPLLIRTVLSAAFNKETHEAIAGKDYFIENFSKNEYDTLEITNNNELYKIISQTPYINLAGYLNNYSVFIVKNNKGENVLFPFNFDKKESVMDNYELSELDDIINKDNKIVNLYVFNEQFLDSLSEAKEGKELWFYFLVTAIAFLMIEYYLSRSLIKN